MIIIYTGGGGREETEREARIILIGGIVVDNSWKPDIRMFLKNDFGMEILKFSMEKVWNLFRPNPGSVLFYTPNYLKIPEITPNLNEIGSLFCRFSTCPHGHCPPQIQGRSRHKILLV